MASTSSQDPTLLTFNSLPYDVLFQIFGYMSYHEVSQHRMICRHANAVCHSVLSSGAEKLRMRLSRVQTKLKNQLPRRESARRGHLASDLLEVINSVENRVSIIRLALDRYLVTGQITFFPGKVLDEAFKVIKQIENLSPPTSECFPPPAPFTALQKVQMLRDLRDLSTMASEHIDDVILPCLRSRSTPVEPMLKRLASCRYNEIGVSPDNSSSSPAASSLQSPALSLATSASNETAASSQEDSVMRLCGLFFEQFRNISTHIEDMKNQQKQANNKIIQLSSEMNAVKQQLAQEQLLSASLAKKVEMTEAALAEMRRLTMNSSGSSIMSHACDSTSLAYVSKLKRKSLDCFQAANECELKRRVTRASAKFTKE